MAYTTKHGRNGLGGIADVATAVSSVVQDPCLFEVSRAVSRLHDLQQPTAKTGAPGVKGVGLCSAVRPLKVVTYVAERPWVLPVGAAAIVFGLVGIGYMIGRPR